MPEIIGEAPLAQLEEADDEETADWMIRQGRKMEIGFALGIILLLLAYALYRRLAGLP